MNEQEAAANGDDDLVNKISRLPRLGGGKVLEFI
jgi:hypothetical protein